MDLYRKGDFVSQVTKKQCVSAAMQIMLNIIRPTADRTSKTQASLAHLAKVLSEARNGGTEPRGWARGLEQLGGGKYEVVIAPTRGAAIERAVRAIRATGRPVGLLVWWGAHSWVLHGYKIHNRSGRSGQADCDPPVRDRPLVSAHQHDLGRITRTGCADHAEAARGGLPPVAAAHGSLPGKWTASSSWIVPVV